MRETPAYKKFRLEVSKCVLCPLHETRQNVVVSRGNTTAKLLFIGEAPGETEDDEGEPFVGRSGKLLDEIVEAAGLTPEQFCIINTIKCRPPGNVFPGDSGAAVSARCVLTCMDAWFDQQFDLINPSAVVLVGRKALEWVLFRGERVVPTMQEATNAWYKSPTYKEVNAWFTIYHPSFLLRTRNGEPDRYRESLRLTDKTLRRAKRAALKGEFPTDKPVLVKANTPTDKQGRLF